MHKEIETQQDRDLKCLDGLIADYGHCSMLEHLRAARRNLLGSMPGEYSLSLRLAKESAGDVPDKGTRSEIRKILSRLSDPMDHKPSRSEDARMRGIQRPEKSSGPLF